MKKSTIWFNVNNDTDSRFLSASARFRGEKSLKEILGLQSGPTIIKIFFRRLAYPLTMVKMSIREAVLGINLTYYCESIFFRTEINLLLPTN